MQLAVRITTLASLVFAIHLSLLVDVADADVKRGEQKVESKRATWAHIELKGAYQEGATSTGLFGAGSESMSDVLGRLNRAAKDKSLSGVVLRINNPSIGWAKLNEFRQAIGRVRSSGKKVYAWLADATSMDYLLATSCDEIVMPESGTLMLLGLRTEVSFYKNLLDKLDIKADMLRVGEFKSAAEPYTRTEMSPAFRLEMEAILDDYYAYMVDLIAKGRNLKSKQVKTAIDKGPYTATEAQKLGLITRVAYEDQLEDLMKKFSNVVDVRITQGYGKKKTNLDFSGPFGMINLLNTMLGPQAKVASTSLPKIAIIHANGMIMSGSSTSSILGGSVLGSDTLIKAIKKANRDPRVKAIVLRVDSPGGSALASDLMWRALEKVDKPFIASMGDVAASGGYYISMGADTIFAEPGTLTGSIGVVGGKVAVNGLFEKAGVTTTVLQRGKNSGVMSTLTGYSESEKKAMVKILHDVYAQFVRKAAQGRHMDEDKLERLARGRVYTGAMALKIGLVDKLGTLEDAIAFARKQAGLKPEDRVERLVLPPPVNPLEQFLGPLGAETRQRAMSGMVVRDLLDSLPAEVATTLKAAHLINLLAKEKRLMVMPYRIRVH